MTQYKFFLEKDVEDIVGEVKVPEFEPKPSDPPETVMCQTRKVVYTQCRNILPDEEMDVDYSSVLSL